MKGEHPTCLTCADCQEQLDGHLQHSLPPARARAVQHHLAWCDLCRDMSMSRAHSRIATGEEPLRAPPWDLDAPAAAHREERHPASARAETPMPRSVPLAWAVVTAAAAFVGVVGLVWAALAFVWLGASRGPAHLTQLMTIFLAASLVALAFSRILLARRLAQIHGLWDDIYVRLVERCQLVGQLSALLRKHSQTESTLVDDIDYLLGRMEETNDPHIHAAVQNGLVLTVQTALEHLHQNEQLQRDAAFRKTLEVIGVVDTQLLHLRDRFNASVRVYNRLLNILPFSIAARLMRATERALFPMLIPWWSTDPAAYGSTGAEDIRQTLQRWRAPRVLAPSQRIEWSTRAGLMRAAEKLR